METLRWLLRCWLWLCCFLPVLVSCETYDGGPGTEDRWVNPPESPFPPVVGQASKGDNPMVADTVPAHLDTALAYVGTVESGGENRGEDVRRFLGSVGLGGGYAWCAAFVSYCLEAPPRSVVFPEVRSALAQDFITRRSMKASNVLMGLAEVPPGAVVIWRKGNGIFGHAGFAVDWAQECGRTVEGNTSRGAVDSGSRQDQPTPTPSQEGNSIAVDRERNGDGVWRRRRCIEPGNYFRIVSFTPVRYTNHSREDKKGR